MKLFHGTSLNRFEQIKKDGFIGSNSQIWNVSEPETTYFYPENYLIEYGDLDQIDGHIDDLVIDQGKRLAGESAEFVLGTETTNLRRVVMMFDSEDLDPEYLEQDSSCDGMQHCMQYSKPIPISKIKGLWIDAQDLTLFAIYFIGMVHSVNNDQYRTCTLHENEDINYNIRASAVHFYNDMCMNWYEWFSYEYELEEHYIKGENLINSYSHEVLNQI